MAGVKGSGGPVPKRSDQRRRRNAPPRPVKKAAAGKRKPTRPRADPKWHPVAKRWYQSLAASGQAVFYEPSDWALAVLLAESISRELQPQPVFNDAGEVVTTVARPPKGSSLAAWLKGMTALLVAEGDRRRLQIELQQPAGAEEEAASVSSLDAWRSRVDGTG